MNPALLALAVGLFQPAQTLVPVVAPITSPAGITVTLPGGGEDSQPSMNRAARRRAMKRLGMFAGRVKRSVW